MIQPWRARASARSFAICSPTSPTVPATSTSSALSHTFPSAGTWTVTLTVTDGWGKAASTTRQVTVTAT